MTREEKLSATVDGLVRLMLAWGCSPATAFTVAGLFSSGVEEEWKRKEKA